MRTMDTNRSRLATPYRPNPNKVLQLAIAGAVATVAMLALAYALPLVGMPEQDFAAVGGALFNDGYLPAQFSGAWWAGLGIHVALAVFAFPFLFDYLADRQILTSTRWFKGAMWGATLWLVAEGVVKPIAGQGFFSRFMPTPALTSWLSLVCWLAYGLLLDGMTRVRIAHQLTDLERRAA